MTKPTYPTSRRGLNRRQLLKATGGTAALLAAAKLNFPAGAFAQGAGPEVKAAKLGFIALTDASPLFVAKEKGIFAKYGMPDVEVQKQLRGQWHRRRAYPDPDAVSDFVRQGDAEQSADADVHHGAAQSERSVHFGRQGI
jgi:hypothetical protein